MLNEHTLPPLSGGKPRHAVILVHGLGDSGAGLIGLGDVWRQALPDTEFLAPDAPFPCDMAPFGYQWFSLQNRSPAAILANVREASPILDAYIDEVQASRALPSLPRWQGRRAGKSPCPRSARNSSRAGA